MWRHEAGVCQENNTVTIVLITVALFQVGVPAHDSAPPPKALPTKDHEITGGVRVRFEYDFATE